MTITTQLKVYVLQAIAFIVTIADIHIILSTILLITSIGYTAQKWYGEWKKKEFYKKAEKRINNEK